MEHKPQNIRVKAVERLLDQLRQEGRLVVKPVVTHPPKLPYKRHNPNQTGLKRYELKGGRYLMRSSKPRRNRKCKNLNRERLCQERSAEGEATDSSEPELSEISTDSTVSLGVVPANKSLISLNGDKCTDSVSTASDSPKSNIQEIHLHHHQYSRSSNSSEDDSQALFFQMDHSMFYLSSLEDGFLTEEITEHV